VANNSRSAIDAALFAQLRAAYDWHYTSMHFQLWDSFDAANQPAFFLRRILEDVQQQKAYGLNKYTLRYECWIYLRTDNNNEASNPYTDSVGIDTLVDAVDAVLAANPVTSRNNLGGLVDNCYISGQILIADGTDNGQGVVRIPITVITGI
jgi:hypothetical protein